ncbi:SDR family oxidoreductase [Caballeronia sp. LZ029]|uniref:SDR family oxidoreductase n=1 Tax=Caballeronia sp. LZ029 TaxID=3038564 RepID=UPI002855D585|nr:SDR family oxidoreductase [Caballeronia sp. LZ029]MDR5741714.1 SDR family oxidoreductase [Caballeronia sp. LZ029]
MTAVRLKVFITGASSGIGLALAEEYVKRGAVLGLVARRADSLAAFAARHPQSAISIYPADVRDADALADAARRFIAEHGPADIVIANAGMSRGALTGHGDLDTFRTVMDVNYFGMVATFEPFVASMTSARRGTLVGIASVAGVRGLPGGGAYSASKSAVAKYLEALRVEMRPLGVAVVTIAPGYVRSEMTAHNPYRMPFLMDADRFAAKTADAINRKVRYATFPWQMRIAGMLMHALPRWLYDALAERAPRKPRASE